MTESARKGLLDQPVPLRIRLAGAWAATVLLYIYNDLFVMYRPGIVHAMATGHGSFARMNQVMLLGMSAAIAIPSVMVLLSLILPANVSRWANVVLGVFYTLFVVATVIPPPHWANYIALGLIESAMTATIAWWAWTWPKASR